VPIRHAQPNDLEAIVAVYNAAIPGRMATADTEPVTVASREPWFRDFTPAHRPLWVMEGVAGDGVAGSTVDGWLGLRSFYGRPAYRHTVEVAVYVAPAAQRRGVAQALLAHAMAAAPALDVVTMLGFIFTHNAPSIALFERAGFGTWGRLPRVALLDGVERDLSILGLRLG
jgi:phosphinothricin acetyltransferase